MGDITADQSAESYWFSEKTLDVLIFKINRRPISAFMLAVYEPPSDLYAHLEQILAEAHEVTSGRRIQRRWRVGNLEFDDVNREIRGRIGWTRSTESLQNQWDDDSKSFLEDWTMREDSAVSPFVILVDDELVGVLRHPSFSTEETVNLMLEHLLNQGERDLEAPTVAWNVDPIGDAKRFDEWFSSMDQVLTLTLAVKRPNPDGAKEFEEVERRLDELEAEYIQQSLKARDETVGLDKAAVRRDRSLTGFIEAAMRSYGWVKGTGKKNGKRRSFNQLKQDQLREPIDDVGGDWQTASDNVLKAVRAVRDRRHNE